MSGDPPGTPASTGVGETPGDAAPRRAPPPAADSYRELLDAAPVGIVVHADGVIRYANRMIAEILGVDDPDVLRGRHILEFVPEEDHGAATERIRRIQEHGEATSAREYPVSRPDGEERYVEARGLPVQWEGETCVQVAIRDVTDRKRTEEALRRSERRFRQVFERVQDPIYISDEEGRILEANPAFAELFGYEDDRLRQINARDLYADPADRDRFRREIEETGTVEDFEVRLKRSDGREMICELSSVLVRDGDGVRYEGIIRDVTEERQAREEWQHRALHDDLTGLPNRSLLWDRMEHAIERADRRQCLFGVLFVDIDDFKAINDRASHSRGDRVLREAARCMSEVLRDEDTVARIGGDEFAVVLEAMEEPRDMTAAVRRLRESVGDVERIPGTDEPLSISVGAALYDPAGANDEIPTIDRAKSLLEDADRAMLERKRDGQEGDRKPR